ncbi:hypothetical protein OC835_003629 [Tilletia horrida]|nr:hypothetical protein OC835_003629 [Tilletia horrida]
MSGSARAGAASGNENVNQDLSADGAQQSQGKKRKLSLRLTPLARRDQNRHGELAAAYDEESSNEDDEEEDDDDKDEDGGGPNDDEDGLDSDDDLPDLKVKVEIPKVKKERTRASGKKAGKQKQDAKSAAQNDGWLPVEFGIKVFSAVDPKAKTQKDKRSKQVGAQRILKLTTPTTYALFRSMLRELVKNESAEDRISGDLENWNIAVQLGSTGSLYSHKTALNEEVYKSFIEELQASFKRSAAVFVEEKVRLTEAQPSAAATPPQLKSVDVLKYTYPAVQNYDMQLLTRWICNDKTCKQRSTIAPSCYVNPRCPSVHINLKSAHRFAWASALAEGVKGVTLEFPPATAEFMGPTDSSGTPILVQDDEPNAKKEPKVEDDEDVRPAQLKQTRRKPLQPAKKKAKLEPGSGTTAENSIDLDLFSSDIEMVVVTEAKKEKAPTTGKGKAKGKGSKSAGTPAALPNGPDMQLAEFIKSCSVREKLAGILKDADYDRVDELVELEKDAEVKQQLGITGSIAHQFGAAMARWRKLVPTTSPGSGNDSIQAMGGGAIASSSNSASAS